MNREIEFRGRTIPYKDDDFEYEGEWVYGYYHEDHNGKGYIIQADRSGRLYPGVNVIPSTIGQFTGLTDKNGAKIWEGDILIVPGGAWGIVVWKAPFFEVTISETESSLYSREWLQECEVFGNRFDNPELIQS